MKKYIIVALALILTVALCVSLGASAFANTTVPSVEQKEVPELNVGGKGTVDGQLVIRVKVESEVEEDKVVIYSIPPEDYDFYSAGEFSEVEEYAEGYKILCEAESLGDVIENLAEVLASITDKYTVDDLVVKDVFAFDLHDDSEAQQYLDADPQNFIELDFVYNVKADDILIVIQYIDGKWVALEARYGYPEDGGVVMQITRDGLMGFVVLGK